MPADLQTIARQPLGLAFEIPDLLLARATAEAHALRLVVETDHHSDCEELEEVLALYAVGGEACHWLIWRDAADVVVQPIPGRSRRFASLASALEWLAPDRATPVSDVDPACCRTMGWTAPRQPHTARRVDRQGGGWQFHPAEA